LSPQNFRETSLLAYFLSLFIRPTYGIKRILEEKPSFKRIVVFLFWVSILRGIVEGVWMLLKEGQFTQVLASPILLKSYLWLGAPFIISSITCGYVRWAGFAFLPCLFAKFLGKKGDYKDFLRVNGVIMGIYLVTILPNFAYLFFRLPMIQFNVSRFYNPAIGIGQMITGVWLVFIIYKATRIICGLSKYQSFLAGLSVLLVNLGALVFGSLVFFNLPSLVSASFKRTLNTATFVFIIITLLSIPVFLWLGMRLIKSKGLEKTEKLVRSN